jgi:hypothetical protein
MTCDPSCRQCNPPPEACARCNNVIPRSERHPSGHGNLAGGLRLVLGGWYGGTIDPFLDVDMYLCDTCARRFLRDNRWLATVSEDLTPPQEVTA